jgi:pimeloyl-ACP methyl ester carboxylesterase
MDQDVTDPTGSIRHPSIRLHMRGWSPEFIEACRQSVSVPHELADIQAPILLIRRRYGPMVPFVVSIAILNHIASWHLVLLNNCGHWPPFGWPAEWAAQVLAFLRATESGRPGSKLN